AGFGTDQARPAIPIKRPQQAELIDGHVNVLRKRGEGIHVSEVASLGLPHVIGSVSPQLVFSLASIDSRIRSTVGQYLYLAEWGDVRRLSPLEAVKFCLRDATGPLAFEQIHAIVQGLIKRPCDESTVSACLQAIDAEFDQVLQKWLLPSVSEDT